jgi:hypothetical protein
MSDEPKAPPAEADPATGVTPAPTAVNRRAIFLGIGGMVALGGTLGVASLLRRQGEAPVAGAGARLAQIETPTPVVLSDAPTSTPAPTPPTADGRAQTWHPRRASLNGRRSRTPCAPATGWSPRHACR